MRKSKITRPGLPMCAALLLLAGCGGGEPYSYVPVSGKVTYDDGTPIPVEPLILTFFPLAPPVNAKTFPRAGMARVDKLTGEFRSATSHKTNDGLIRGRHKVTVTNLNRTPLSPDIVPLEYSDPDKTPLEVDTDRPDSFTLTVHKPAGAKATKAAGTPK